MLLPLKLDYLPYHFLLTSVGLQGKLVYFDVSIGKKVTTHSTNLGECDVMCHNPTNGVVHLGHNNGCVTLWTPTNNKNVASILCHKSKVRSVAVDYGGLSMATSDSNGNLKIWDIRMLKEYLSYKSQSMVNQCCFSQRGLLSFSTGRSVNIWNLRTDFSPISIDDEQDELSKRHKNLYLTHVLCGSRCNDLSFVPYEDCLGIGTTNGFTSIIVPGAGEPNYDIFENDPFETRKKRNNRIVNQLLDKLRPDMIQMNPNFIASLPQKSLKVERQPEQKEMRYARKNLTKSKITGYRGVIQRRYAKYRIMKEFFHRKEQLRKQLNIRKKN